MTKVWLVGRTWRLPSRSDRAETYGDTIRAALRPGGAFCGMLASFSLILDGAT